MAFSLRSIFLLSAILIFPDEMKIFIVVLFMVLDVFFCYK